MHFKSLWVSVAGFYLFFGNFSGGILSHAGFANARDFLVKLRHPGMGLAPGEVRPGEVRAETLGLFSQIPDAQVTGLKKISEGEGLYRLSFASNVEAARAREFLATESAVERIVPNFRYRPAISYRWREAQPNPSASSALPERPSSWLMDWPKDWNPANASKLPDVEQPPSSFTPGVDPLEARDWALKAIRMPEHSEETPSATTAVTTAVIDTGVDYNHEDLIAAMWRDTSDPAVVGYDFVHDHAKPYDLRHFDVEGCLTSLPCRLGLDVSRFLVNPGHGTHCAGHVAAVASNSLGIRGVGTSARLMALKFFYDVGEIGAGSGDDAAAIQAIDYAVKNGARIISASWGARIPREAAETSELKAALLRAQKAGVLFVVAAGNDGVDQELVENPSYPAAFHLDHMIVVAASNPRDELADFSNYGARTVDLAAPGVRILSTTVGSKYEDVVARFKDSRGVEHELAWDGTSMAAPIVAGAAALVWSRFPEEDYKQIRNRLLNSVRKVSALKGKVATEGVLDVSAALR